MAPRAAKTRFSSGLRPVDRLSLKIGSRPRWSAVDVQAAANAEAPADDQATGIDCDVRIDGAVWIDGAVRIDRPRHGRWRNVCLAGHYKRIRRLTMFRCGESLPTRSGIVLGRQSPL